MLVGFAALLSGVPVGSAEGRRYHAHDKVAIVANTVGPFNNPTETYPVTVALQCVCMFINDLLASLGQNLLYLSPFSYCCFLLLSFF